MEKTVSLYLLKIQWLVSLFATIGMVYLLTVDCISAGFQQLIKRALKFKISDLFSSALHPRQSDLPLV